MKKQTKSLNPTTKTIFNSLIKLPTPINISYMWNMGSMMGLILTNQIMTGLMISMHYTANTSMAFESTMHIMRDVEMGWLMRNLHMNGASMFFILMYMHISRGMLFSSYLNKETWYTGMIILLTTMATAFLGYVLPWGQMSFWGATVITNLASAIPLVGKSIVMWLWGGFSVSNATLNRFFSLHFMLPFLIAITSLIHLSSLHNYMSTNPIGTNKKKDMIKFHPSLSWKDLNPMTMMMTMILITSSLYPNMMGDPENFNMANPMITPIHIQPEWYFLFAYAILRAIPNKLGGVLALLMSIIMISMPSTKKKNKSTSKFNPKKKTKFSIMALSFMILTWLGANQVEYPFEQLSMMMSMMYFTSIIMM